MIDASLSNSLGDLAARIRAEHEACRSCFQRGLEHAVTAGRLLLEAKAQLNEIEHRCSTRTIRSRMAGNTHAVDDAPQMATADPLLDMIGGVP